MLKELTLDDMLLPDKWRGGWWFTPYLVLQYTKYNQYSQKKQNAWIILPLFPKTVFDIFTLWYI